MTNEQSEENKRHNYKTIASIGADKIPDKLPPQTFQELSFDLGWELGTQERELSELARDGTYEGLLLRHRKIVKLLRDLSSRYEFGERS